MATEVATAIPTDGLSDPLCDFLQDISVAEAAAIQQQQQTILDHVLHAMRNGGLSVDRADDETKVSTQKAEASDQTATAIPPESTSTAGFSVEAVDYARFQQDFKRLRLLGRGAFGEVWHCQRLSDNKEFAVKVVKYRTGGLGRNVEGQVVREARMLAMMNHQNILHYHEAWIERHKNVMTSSGSETTVPGSSGGARSQSVVSSPTISPSLVSAPPPSPTVRARNPCFGDLCPESDEGTGDEPSYHGGSIDGSCGFDVVFFEWEQDEQGMEPSRHNQVSRSSEIVSAAATAPPAATTPAAAAVDPFLGGRGQQADQPPSTPTASIGRGSGGSGGAAVCTPSSIGRHRSSTSNLEDFEPEFTATMYIQVELCRDETLQGWLEKRNELIFGDGPCDSAHSVRNALRIIAQCVRALQYLHSKNCVHRDVKPSNVLFARGESKAVRLGDLGLAKVLGEDGDVGGFAPSPPPLPSGARPRSGAKDAAVGTPSYASPEQLSGRPVDTATDVYALGLVLAELLSPVSTLMERATVLHNLRENRELPLAVAERFSLLSKLAVQMTEPEPADRPEMHEILRAIRKAQKELRLCGSASVATNSDVGSAVGAQTSASKEISPWKRRQVRGPRGGAQVGRWQRRRAAGNRHVFCTISSGTRRQ